MKLHIGCGSKYLPGYKHVDIMDHTHIDFIANANDLSFTKNDSVDEIYACHVLEHFKRHEIEAVLIEWNRVMKVGGIIRIAVPDFSTIVEEYKNCNDLNKVLGLLYGGQNYEYNIHYQVFDFKRLEYLLTNSGFTYIKRYNWQDFLPHDYDDYSRAYMPHMDFNNGRLMSLNVIATKK